MARSHKANAPPGDNAPLAEWAQFWRAYGEATGAVKPFPLRSGSKKPLPGVNWQELATWDAGAIAGFWTKHPNANIGLAIQPGFVAVDVDDMAALEALEAEHGELHATLEQRTPRGGLHLIYRTDLNTGNSTGALPKGIDIRGVGGYIVGAGSKVKS